MILSDKDIKEYIKQGKIKITPAPNYDEQLGPCTLDLRLGNAFKVFKPSRYPYIDLKRPIDLESIMEEINIADDSPFILQPGEFVLAVTKEDFTLSNDIMGRLDGRSSLGRLGVIIHSTAARFDPGWSGMAVIELGNLGVMPVVLYAGMRICALTFETLSSPCEKTYLTKKNPKYAKQDSPTASRISEEFQEKKAMVVNDNDDELNNWPITEGRYYIGNKFSPVAVCTNATVEGIELDMNKVAICGKCVTENVGIEKMVQNIVTNPYIRFFILCGKISKGHFVEQAVVSLKNNGVDQEKSIIGAVGNMPHLKGLDLEIIERFRLQVEPINLDGEVDSAKIMQVVEECLKRNPGKYNGEKIEFVKVEEIEAKGPFDWREDPNGFFVVSLRPAQKKIVVEHLQNGKTTKKVVGESAQDICRKIGQMQMVGDFEQTVEHARYLGRELAEAEFCLKNNQIYEQDADIEITKEVIQQIVEKPKEKENIFGWHD